MSDTEVNPSTILFQVTFDAREPHAIAAFWAEVLGYETEDSSALVEQLVAAGHLPASEVVQVGGRAAFRVGAGLTDPTGVRPRLLFQLVPEGKAVKNRVHLDLRVGVDHIDAEIARTTALGATLAWESNDRGGRCVTMRDPEGNEFCLT